MADINSLGWLQGAGGLLQAFGLFAGGQAARITGDRVVVTAQFNQRQDELDAGTAIALGQHQAMEERRQTELIASRALAVAASSGGAVTDPTIVRLIAAGRGIGAYRANVALYEGEAKARALRMQGIEGMVAGYEAQERGISTQLGRNLAGAGEVAKAGLSLYSKYGMGGPVSSKGDANLILDAGTPSGAGAWG